MKMLMLGFAVAASWLTNVAHADDYGCKVLLCLANPNGPKAVSECVPPINQLFYDLSHRRPFPTCDQANAPDGQGGRSWAQPGMSYYDPCPAGTTALPSSTYAVQGGLKPPGTPQFGSTYYTGIGEGDGLQPTSGDGVSPMAGKVCVGNQLGSTVISTGNGDDFSSFTAGVYDRVVMLDAQGSPRIIDVFVDSTLYRRVRW